MRLFLTITLGLLLVALQAILGLKAFYPEVFEGKVDMVDELIQSKEALPEQFTREELNWLAKRPTVIVGVDPEFYPLEMFDERGRYSGLGGDYMRLLAKLTGLKFQVLKIKDWASVETLAQQKQLDMFMAAAKTARRSEYMLFTEPYINMPGAIMTRRGSGLDTVNIQDLSGKRVAVANSYSWHDFLREHHPEIIAVPVSNTLEALQQVVMGDADAVIDYEFNLKEKSHIGGIMQVQTAGSVDSSYGHSIAVRQDWPELFGVISKALSQITPEERQVFSKKWLGQERQSGQEKHTQWIFFFLTEFVLLGILVNWLWRAQVNKEVTQRLRAFKARTA